MYLVVALTLLLTRGVRESEAQLIKKTTLRTFGGQEDFVRTSAGHCEDITRCYSVTMSSPQSMDTDIFLIGKTGNGKSSTGNSILGREAFATSDAAQSETFSIQVGGTQRKNRKIKVVDGPGLAETRLNAGDASQKLVKDMTEGILQCPGGFHAMVLVLKYGSRFTEEELQVIQTLKSVFGGNFVRDFCVIVFTHGELFDMKNRKSPRPFIEWCREQTGPLQNLLEECNYRVALFNNSEEEKLESQVDDFLSVVDGLSNAGKRYTNEIFQKFSEEREKMNVRENEQNLKQSLQPKVNQLLQRLDQVKSVARLDGDVTSKMDVLCRDARDLDLEINSQDKGTGVLLSLRTSVQNIPEQVQGHRQLLEARQREEDLERQRVEAERQHQAQVQAIQNQQHKKKKRKWYKF